MEKPFRYEDLGLIEYGKAMAYQEERFNLLVDFKRNPGERERPAQYLLFCEHPHVYTLGKSGDESNLLVRKEFLKRIQATYYQSNRGGDITYHGPGQVVGYPILDLDYFRLGLKQYIALLEDSVIGLLSGYWIQASRMERATGVWLEAGHPVRARKICAIGVRSGRFVTMHGFALNVNTNLDYFTYINPCGLEIRGVTSMEKELGSRVDMDEVKIRLKEILKESFRSLMPRAGS
jgi:lipoyl(octanoyl) transferase